MKSEEFATARKAMNHDKLSIWEKVKANLPYITAVANSSLFILHTSFLIACTGNTLYHHYQPLPAEGWERSDTVCFDVPKAEEDIDGSLFIGLRTAAHIGIQNIVLAVEQCDKEAKILHRDTIHYSLTDDEGNATAQGVNYHQYENRQLPFRLQKGKSATVRIHHLMRREDISGITEVGIRIERH